MPTKKAKSQKIKDQPETNRRDFLGRFWLLLGGAAVIETGVVVADFMGFTRPVAPTGDTERVFVAGPVENFAPGSVTPFQQGKFYLARLEDGGFMALSRSCTHLGCTVPWVEEQRLFMCPCHASTFDIRGEATSPPAPRPLDMFAIRIENNIVKVDLDTKMERRAFSNDQVFRV